MKFKSSKSNPIKPINLGIIENQKSYWANHFYSVIQCLQHHKNLQYSPRRLENYPLSSLSDMRGNFPTNFFENIQKYLENWGFQYFLVNFLNQKSSHQVVETIIEQISQRYNVEFSTSFLEYTFYISGNDSSLTPKLQDYFTDVFPSELRELKVNTQKLINESDICLIIEDSYNQEKVALFGEIEGVHGNKLRNKSYWDKKQDFCVFSFGVQKGKNKQCYFENIHIDNINRVCLFFEEDNYVVKDFHMTLEYIKHLFYSASSFKLKTNNEEFDFFLYLIKRYWNQPIEQLLHQISKFLDGSDLVGEMQSSLPIITDIQAS